MLNLSVVLASLAPLFAFANHRYLKLPSVIGIMLISLVLSLTVVVTGRLG